MRSLLVGTALATLATVAGCANGLNAGGAQDRRGSLRVTSQPRVLVVGPASQVHTSVDGGKPVALFVVAAVNGDDRDCAALGARAVAPPAAEVRHQVRVPEGSELCASADRLSAPTDVLWHARLAARRTTPGRTTLVLQQGGGVVQGAGEEVQTTAR